MPQASDELRREFGITEARAFEVVKAGRFRNHRGMVYLHRMPKPKERRALDFLCDEWDWSYSDDRADFPLNDVDWKPF